MKKIWMTGAVLAGFAAFCQGALIASESFETDATGTGGIYVRGNVGRQGVVVGNSGFDEINVWLNYTGPPTPTTPAPAKSSSPKSPFAKPFVSPYMQKTLHRMDFHG